MSGEIDAAIGPDRQRHAVDTLIQSLGVDMVLTGDAIEKYCRDWHGGRACSGRCDRKLQDAGAQSLAFREGINEGQATRGPRLRTDVSVPLSRLSDFVRDAEQAVAAAVPDGVCVSYGHVGDGNVHLNVLPPGGLSRAEIEARIHDAKKAINTVVDTYHGSISAEHGIGRLKKADYERCVSLRFGGDWLRH